MSQWTGINTKLSAIGLYSVKALNAEYKLFYFFIEYVVLGKIFCVRNRSKNENIAEFPAKTILSFFFAGPFFMGEKGRKQKADIVPPLLDISLSND